MLKIKDIKGFEDYTIDTNGNVFSKRKHKYLKQTINRNGYCKVTLQKNKYKKMFSVHRLVAETFIPNPNNLPQVNHIDYDRTNNKINNLEWCTPKENTSWSIKNGRFENMKKINSDRMKKNKVYLLGYKKANEATKKKIQQFDKNNNFIKEYESISQASRELGVTIASISYCANGKRKKVGGFIWRFV